MAGRGITSVRVLTDAIHADLWESLVILFEERFGWELYRPIGMDWYDRGIWNFERDGAGIVVAHQFLDPWPSDIVYAGDHSLRVSDSHPGRMTKLVTHADARAQKWDLVIATLAENEMGLHGFAREVGAHYGIQVGNQGAPNHWAAAEFALLSVTTPGFTPWVPFVRYHQEFALTPFSWPPMSRDLIMNRVQCFTGTPEYERMRRLAAMAPDLRFRWYGHCGEPDDLYGGNAMTTAAMASEMRDANVAYHVKRWSDGYGHVGFQWFANGRPVLGSASYYADKLMGPLWVEGETSFDLDAMHDADVVALLRRLRDDDEYHERISRAARARFDAEVSFDREADAIRVMLDGVLSDRVSRDA